MTRTARRALLFQNLRKSPYEGRTRWREQGRKKPVGSARIAACSVKMSEVSEHSDRDFITRKKIMIKNNESRGGHMMKFLLSELDQAGRKIFGTRSGPCAMTKCQMFSRPALPLSQ